MNRLHQKYQKEIAPQLVKEFNLKNPFQAAKVTKVCLNVGIAEPQHQDQALKSMGEQLAIISGQKPKRTAAKKSIAGFKLRAGDSIGLAVTLRGEIMYQFLDKLISIVLPRVKDFQGVPADAFDSAGNYSLGLKEQIVFPEIDYDTIDKVRGLQINIAISQKSKTQSRRLLELMGMPFEKVLTDN